MPWFSELMCMPEFICRNGYLSTFICMLQLLEFGFFHGYLISYACHYCRVHLHVMVTWVHLCDMFTWVHLHDVVTWNLYDMVNWVHLHVMLPEFFSMAWLPEFTCKSRLPEFSFSIPSCENIWPAAIICTEHHLVLSSKSGCDFIKKLEAFCLGAPLMFIHM